MLKFFERLRARLLGSTTTGLLAVLALGGTVAAITSPNFTYTTTKTAYYSIHATGLTPNDHLAQYTQDIGGVGGLFTGNGACFLTPVNLPQGSRITQLALWFRSPTGTNPSVFFVRNNLTDGTASYLVSNALIVDDTNMRKLAVLPVTGGSSLVSNTGFTYGFTICPGAGGTFHGARIAYTYTSAGD